VEENALKKHIQTELDIFELVGPVALGRTLESNKVTGPLPRPPPPSPILLII
jgi:hypothetical protein